MFEERVETIRNHFEEFLREFYDIDPPELTTESPPQVEMGDLALPFPFELARILRKAPREIAAEVVEHVKPLEGVSRIEAAGAGFINVFFDRSTFFRDLYGSLCSEHPPDAKPKVIVEHTNINPNKAAHIGHLRNAILGDTFVRLMRSEGRTVEVQNYIDNTGVQVADVVVGFHYLRGMNLEQVRDTPDPFDYYCWDLYAEVSEWYEEDPRRLDYRQEVLASIEEGSDHFYQLGEHISERIVRAHLQTMDRIDVSYDVLPRESEILHLHFWEDAFEQLKRRNAIYFQEDGPNAGCWVMDLPGEGEQPTESKIIVRSNGTVTYVGKDIAYQLWKFGLLNKTFHYQPFHNYENGHVVWVTRSKSLETEEPEFGGATRVYNVIDVRQSYLQRVVTQGLHSLGYEEQARQSIHFSYEMVALSPRCCLDLGIELSDEDRERPHVEVSGRKGLGVKADDLIDTLIEKSLAEVTQRQSDLSEEERRSIAIKIAVGALRYFMLKYTRNSVIAFDFDEALSFEGETGPYLQYSVVRSKNIFRKVFSKEDPWTESYWRERQPQLWTHEEILDLLADDNVWSLVRSVAQTGSMVGQAVQSLEIAVVAKHAFAVAQQFNYFYHTHHIMSEPDPIKKTFYLTVADLSRLGLLRLLGLLGIEVPERM